MKKNIAALIMILFGLSAQIYSKPYYFYTVENKEGTNSDIYALDLENNNKSLFLSGTGTVYKLWVDDNQERIYLLRHRQLEVYEINDTSRHYVLIDACEEVFGIVYLDKSGLVYVSWTDPSDVANAIENEDEPVRTGVFDVNTMRIINTLNEEIIIDEKAFASEEQSMIFTSGYEPEENLHIIQTLSTKTNTIIAKTIINDIEPETIYKLVEDGDKGLALIGYNFPAPAHINNYFMVYDLLSNTGMPAMHFPFRSKGFILKSKQSVIAWEVVIDGKIRSGEYATGNISVFNYNTGKLIKNYSLPPDGELLVFKNYPEQFYYLTQDKQVMNIPLKLTP